MIRQKLRVESCGLRAEQAEWLGQNGFWNWQNHSYRSYGIIHRERGERPGTNWARCTVNHSGRALLKLSLTERWLRLTPGFAAGPGRRMLSFKRSTLQGRVSPPGGGFGSMTNTQNFSPAWSRDEFYKNFARLAKSAFPIVEL